MKSAKRLLSFAAAAISLPMMVVPAPAPAQVGKLMIECKPLTSGLGITQTAAEESWRAWVVSHYGQAWADLGIARNKSYTSQNLGVTTMHYVNAQPCSRVSLKVAPLGNQVLQP